MISHDMAGVWLKRVVAGMHPDVAFNSDNAILAIAEIRICLRQLFFELFQAVSLL